MSHDAHDATKAPAAGEAILSVRDLTISFSGESGTVSAVDGVSFDVRSGEVVALVGESGCGKSVTALALTGLLPRSARVTGSVEFEGAELLGANAGLLRRIRGASIAYIFQEPMTSLNPVFTVGRQIGEALRVHEGLAKRDAAARAVELLSLVGISSPAERLKQYPHQLSGGIRQRVMIAMAVACNPRILIADEPTTALDVTVQAGILDVLKDLRERLGTSVLLITHDLGVVSDIADRVIVMYAGRAVEHADVVELFGRPRHPYTVGLLGAVPTASARGDGTRLKEVPGLVPVLATQPDSCTFADRCRYADDLCRSERPALQHLQPGHAAACWHPVYEEVNA